MTFHQKKLDWSLDVVYLEITQSCNLSCIYCYNNAKQLTKQSRRSPEKENIKNLIEELAALGVLRIIFTGGEPLLYKDIFEILEFTKDNNIPFKLFTNGTLLDKDTVNKLKTLKPLSVVVSLDSSKEKIHNLSRGANCFKKVVNGIDLLKQEGIPFRINFTILEGINDNAGDVEDAISFFIGKGAKNIVISPVMEFGRARQNASLVPSISKMSEIASIFRSKAKELKWKNSQNRLQPLTFSNELDTQDSIPHSSCGVGTFSCYIKANGDVALCPLLSDKSKCAGNIREEQLKNIWSSSDVFTPFRETTLEDIPECRECSAKFNCVGGCKARVWKNSGEVNEPDYLMCSKMQALGLR